MRIQVPLIFGDSEPFVDHVLVLHLRGDMTKCTVTFFILVPPSRTKILSTVLVSYSLSIT